MPNFFSCEIPLVCCLKCPYRFFSHFCFLLIFLLLMLVLLILFSDGCNQSSSAPFLWSIKVVISIHRSYLQYWWVLFLLLFMIHRVCLRHFWNVRSYAWSLVFLFFGRFVEFLLPFTLRMVSSNLWGRQPKYLSFWRDFCDLVWFPVVFSFFLNILSSPHVWWCLLPVFPRIYKLLL